MSQPTAMAGRPRQIIKPRDSARFAAVPACGDKRRPDKAGLDDRICRWPLSECTIPIAMEDASDDAYAGLAPRHDCDRKSASFSTSAASGSSLASRQTRRIASCCTELCDAFPSADTIRKTASRDILQGVLGQLGTSSPPALRKSLRTRPFPVGRMALGADGRCPRRPSLPGSAGRRSRTDAVGPRSRPRFPGHDRAQLWRGRTGRQGRAFGPRFARP